MLTPRALEIVRRFAENGMKLLLEDPANVRDLLGLTREEAVGAIRFDRMKRVQETFVQRDYRHVESDVVLTAPLRGGKKSGGVVVYILIEHQSEPDELMPLRLLEYVLAIYRAQWRAWLREHPSAAGFRFQPVLPVVFYTGTRTWGSVGQLADLVLGGQLFGRWLPAMESVFISLRELGLERLAEEGGAFGQVLRVLLRKNTPSGVFRVVFREAVEGVDRLPEQEQNRWYELLSYLRALMYNERQESEHEGLKSIVEASARSEQRQQEVREMGKTIAEGLREEGAVKVCRDTVLWLLGKRFGKVPEDIVSVVEATTDLGLLEAWRERAWSVKTINEMKKAMKS